MSCHQADSQCVRCKTEAVKLRSCCGHGAEGACGGGGGGGRSSHQRCRWRCRCCLFLPLLLLFLLLVQLLWLLLLPSPSSLVSPGGDSSGGVTA